MVRGIDSFRKWFAGFEEQYTIIGGTACDLLMTESSLTFRATKDIDLVLIIEAVLCECRVVRPTLQTQCCGRY